MSICCCCLPSPITCLLIGLLVTFLAIYDLLWVYDSSIHALEDEQLILGVLAGIHVLQLISGVCIVIAVLRQIPWLLRGCAFVVGGSGLVFFVKVLFVEGRTSTGMVVWASVVVALFIYLASSLCAAAGIMEIILTDRPVVWYAYYDPEAPPEAQGTPEAPEAQPNQGRIQRLLLVGVPTKRPMQRTWMPGDREAAQTGPSTSTQTTQ